MDMDARVEIGDVLSCTDEAERWLRSELDGNVLVIRAKLEGGSYAYDLESVAADGELEGVEHLASTQVPVAVELASRRHLYGARLDLRDGGLVLHNPNQPAPLEKPDLCNEDETAELAARVIGVLINPELAGHGGRAWMLGHKDNVAHVMLGGGCSGCSMANTTMFDGIARILVARVAGVVSVVDDTNHLAGENPYYR